MIRAPIETSLSTKNSRFSNIFSKIEHRPPRLRRDGDRDRRQVGRERGPRAVLDLRDLAAEVVLDHELLVRRDAQRSRRRARRRSPSRSNAGRIETRSFGAHALDRDVAAGDRGEADEAADLDVLGRDRPLAAARATRRRGCGGRSTRCPRSRAPSETRKRQRSWTCGSQAALPITVSPGASDGGHDRVLGRHDARLVEEDVARRAGPSRLHLVAARRSRSRAPSSLERVDVRIEPAPADHVAARRRHARAAEAREQRAGEQERRADPVRERLVEPRATRCPPRATRTSFGPSTPRSAPRSREQLEHRVDVADARHVRQRHRLVGEQARGEDRQRAVLVPGRRGCGR